MDLKQKIRSIANFPEKGILFRDITTLLQDAEGLKDGIDQMLAAVDGLSPDMIVGPESRGFIFGMPIAYQLHAGFVPVRKPGKLPAAVLQKEYVLEYGTATLEMHADALHPGQKVIVVDDLLATGGTAEAVATMIEQAGAEILAFVFLIELAELSGRERLSKYRVHSILQY